MPWKCPEMKLELEISIVKSEIHVKIIKTTLNRESDRIVFGSASLTPCQLFIGTGETSYQWFAPHEARWHRDQIISWISDLFAGPLVIGEMARNGINMGTYLGYVNGYHWIAESPREAHPYDTARPFNDKVTFTSEGDVYRWEI